MSSQQPPGKTSTVSKKVHIELKVGNAVRRFIALVRIDTQDNVSISLPDDCKLDGKEVGLVTLRTSGKVRILPDLLSSRFGSDKKSFYSICSIYVSVDFNKSSAGLIKCTRCPFTVNLRDAPSEEKVIQILLQHLPQHQDNLPCLKFSCKKCPTVAVVSVDVLVKHFEKAHQEILKWNGKDSSTLKTQGKEDYTCPICSIICFNNSSLMNHMKDYHSSTPNSSIPTTPGQEDIQNGIEVAPGIVVKQEPVDYEEDDDNEEYVASNYVQDSTVKLEPPSSENNVVAENYAGESGESLSQKSQLLKVDLTLDGKFGCLICGKKCKTEKALKQHVQIHLVGQQSIKNEKDVESKRRKQSGKAKTVRRKGVSPGSNIQSSLTGDLVVTLKVDKPKDRRKQVKPQKTDDALDVAQEMFEPAENLVKEEIEEENDDFDDSECEDFDDDDYDPSDDAPGAQKKRRKKTHFSKECPICHKVLTRANSMAVHLRSHTGEKPYKCPQCGRGCQTAQHLKQHMFIHTGEQPHECPICKRKFRDPSSMKRHIRLHDAGRPIEQFIKPTLVLNPETGDMKEELLDPTDGTPIKSEEDVSAEVPNYETTSDQKGLFPCPVCNKVFTSSSSLSTHQRSHSGSRPYSCSYCDKTFLTSQHLKHHTMIHTGEKPHVCSVCGKAFIAKTTMRRHEEIHKADRSPRPPREKSEECDICGKQFMYVKSLIEHRRIHTKERPFSCTVCDKTFAREGNLRIHMYTHTDMYKHRCSHCGKGCVTGSALRIHEAVHTGVKPHVCSTCGKAFADPHRLKVHEYNHTGERPHVCSVCGQGFTTNNVLKIHMRKHTGEKPYLCTFCGKGFRFQKNMKDHQLTHTGELPFRCDQCGKGFRTNWRLTCHSRLHTGEKPYKCSKCGQAFRAHSSLHSHMRRHKIKEGLIPSPCIGRPKKSKPDKPEKPKKPETPKNFTCEHCNTGFSRKDSLKKHMRRFEPCRIATNFNVESVRKNAAGITPFHCEICQKYFSGYTALQRHQKLHERNEDTEKFNCVLCDAKFWRKDHMLAHKRTAHPDQCDDQGAQKKPGMVESADQANKTLESPALQSESLSQSSKTSAQPIPPTTVKETQPRISENLSTNDRFGNSSAQEDLMTNADALFLHRQPVQSQLHQAQFPYPQMLSAQAFLHGAMSHLAQQQPDSQQVQLPSLFDVTGERLSTSKPNQ